MTCATATNAKPSARPIRRIYALGGLPWVLWGISVRILLSLTGHWAIGHFAHHKGQQSWTIAGLPVQGFRLIRTLAALGLAHNIRLPDSAPPRDGLTRQP